MIDDQASGPLVYSTSNQSRIPEYIYVDAKKTTVLKQK